MTDKEVCRFLELMDRRMFIVMHSGVSWKPEYGSELEAIDRELARLRALVGQAHEQKEQAAQDKQTENTVQMVTIKEASSRTGISYDKLRKMCINHQIVHIKTGCKFLINWDRLVAYLNTGEQGG